MSPKRPARVPRAPSIHDEEKYTNFDDFYLGNVFERIDCKPSDFTSTAGLNNGGECIFLRIYDISSLNRGLEFLGFGFYHTSV